MATPYVERHAASKRTELEIRLAATLEGARAALQAYREFHLGLVDLGVSKDVNAESYKVTLGLIDATLALAAEKAP